MTGMEHAIEQATERAELLLAPHFRNVALGGVEDDTHLGALVLRAVDALAEAGLLAPAPLREEWAARYANGGGAVCRTRDEAEAALDRMIRDSHRHRVDKPPAPDIAGIYTRYCTDWVPADRAEGDGSADCGCAYCHTGPFPIMHVCADCGSKRCPRAIHHANPCNGSADQ